MNALPTSASATWDVALADYRAKRALDEASPDDAPNGDEIVTARLGARDHLIEKVASPNGAALALKMRLAFEYSEDFCGLLEGWEKALIADAERLGGAA